MEFLLRVAVSLMIIAPIAVFLGIRAVVGSPSEVSPEFYLQWSADHMWEHFALRSQGAVLYGIGFWGGYYLWLPRSVPLAWWSLLSGVLLICFPPVGTLVAALPANTMRVWL